MQPRVLGAGALVAVAAFMLAGFLRSDVSIASVPAAVALFVTVVIPAAAGVALFGSSIGGRSRLRVLRQQAVESEILRLAMQHEGRLTVIEVSAALALSPEAATHALDSLCERDIADLEITDGGMIVYVFRDARRIQDKHATRGILDA